MKPAKKRRWQYTTALAAALLFFLTLAASAQAVTLGGELQVSGSLAQSNNTWSTSLRGGGTVEVYFPRSSAVEPRLVLQGSLTDESNGGADLGIKYLYLRRRINAGQITVGRQPVSWSYGAMLNLLDYGLGIEDLAAETITPGVDGLRYLHSLGQGRSLQTVLSFPDLSDRAWDDLGYGARLRLPGRGYDLGFMASSQPVTVLTEGMTNSAELVMASDRLWRVGTTYRGDVGEVGAFGGIGFFRLQDSNRSDILLQLGFDYSWALGEFGERTLFLQAEYFRFLRDEIRLIDLAGLLPTERRAELSGTPATAGAAALMTGNHLFIVNLSTQIDMFSSAGLAIMAEAENWTAALTPYYVSDLGGNLELRVQGQLVRDGNGSLNPGLSVGLRYAF